MGRERYLIVNVCMPKISPFLWFDTQAEEAANFYVSVFKNAKITSTARYDENGAKVSGRPAGSVMTIGFELDGQPFTALNGGPIFQFSQAISFVIDCHSQEEVDWFWEKLGDGGEYQPCGWLKDKFGIAWQVVPAMMAQLMGGPDPKKSEAVMKAMLQMGKLDIALLQKAYDEA